MHQRQLYTRPVKAKQDTCHPEDNRNHTEAGEDQPQAMIAAMAVIHAAGGWIDYLMFTTPQRCFPYTLSPFPFRGVSPPQPWSALRPAGIVCVRITTGQAKPKLRFELWLLQACCLPSFGVSLRQLVELWTPATCQPRCPSCRIHSCHPGPEFLGRGQGPPVTDAWNENGVLRA